MSVILNVHVPPSLRELLELPTLNLDLARKIYLPPNFHHGNIYVIQAAKTKSENKNK